jgi:hypothetical protein
MLNNNYENDRHELESVIYNYLRKQKKYDELRVSEVQIEGCQNIQKKLASTSDTLDEL